MKPFNLEEAKAGKPICTRNGDKARIICTDLKGPDYNIVAAVYIRYERENIFRYTNKGEYAAGKTNDNDLCMVEDEEPKCPFKPFDKVLVRDNNNENWFPDFFSHYGYSKDYPYQFYTLRDYYAQCIPYNEETEHLIDTNGAPPEKYVIW